MFVCSETNKLDLFQATCSIILWLATYNNHISMTRLVLTNASAYHTVFGFLQNISALYVHRGIYYVPQWMLPLWAAWKLLVSGMLVFANNACCQCFLLHVTDASCCQCCLLHATHLKYIFLWNHQNCYMRNTLVQSLN